MQLKNAEKQDREKIIEWIMMNDQKIKMKIWQVNAQKIEEIAKYL